MAYAEGRRPSKRFGVICRVVRNGQLHVVPSVTAHDAAHAGALAAARVAREYASQRLKVVAWKVFRGTLQEAT